MLITVCNIPQKKTTFSTLEFSFKSIYFLESEPIFQVYCSFLLVRVVFYVGTLVINRLTQSILHVLLEKVPVISVFEQNKNLNFAVLFLICIG